MIKFLPEAEDLGFPEVAISEVGVRGVVIEMIATVLSYVQIALLVLIIIAGIRWMFSFGNPEKTQAATKTLIHAIVGYLIVFFSYTLVSTIITMIGG